MADFGLTIIRCANARSAASGADIITTITADKKFATILADDMVRPGTHINAVGGDCPGKTELARELLLRSQIFVEYAPQTRSEGEIQQLGPEHPVTELREILRVIDQGAPPKTRSRSSTASVSPSRIFRCCA